MKNIFLKLYQQLLVSLILATLLTYLCITLINQWRLSTHVENVTRGTISLIAKGLDRHEGDQQNEWLQAISRILDLKLLINTNTHETRLFYINSSIFKPTITLTHRIGNSEQFVSAEIIEVNEEIAYATALLILNELGMSEKENRDAQLNVLKQNFSFPVNKKLKNALDLSAPQMRRLQRGDVLIKLDDKYQHQRYIHVFAPYGKTEFVLEIGPIPLFNKYSPGVFLTSLLLLLAFIIMIGIMIVRPLEKRFATLINSVEKVGVHKIPFIIRLSGNDDLNTLAERINEMSERISTLINYQSEFTHAISHDLKTPVSRLRFRLSLLESAKNNTERLSKIEGMHRDIDELTLLIGEILNLAKLQSNENILEIKELKVDTLFTELKNDIELINQGKHILFLNHIEQFYADKNYIKRAISNILTNSIRYANNRITLTIGTHEGKTSIIIEDDGLGIDPKDRVKIFEPFSTLDQSRNKQLGGFGLGLAITKKIVEWHAGNIWVEDSTNLGGAKFVILIPNDTLVFSSDE